LLQQKTLTNSNIYKDIMSNTNTVVPPISNNNPVRNLNANKNLDIAIKKHNIKNNNRIKRNGIAFLELDNDGEFMPNEWLSIKKPENIEKVYRFRQYVTNNIEFASSFHFALQTILPGLSNLTIENIMYPTADKLNEINRLRRMLILRGDIARINLRIRDVNGKLNRIAADLESSSKSPLTNHRTNYFNLISEKYKMFAEAREKIAEFKVFLDAQNKHMAEASNVENQWSDGN
ncbi:hypothetical protein COBT_002569, partial [Conglomerata obtusa]